MLQRTPLFLQHQQASGKIVDFHGWEMPLNYGSQIEEHRTVRNNIGMFDVSHMTVIDIKGKFAKAFLRFVLANDVEKLSYPGKGLYTVMLNEAAGIIDDLIVYFIDQDNYRLITNSSTKEKVLSWLQQQKDAQLAWRKSADLEIIYQQTLCIIAVQGPNSTQVLGECLNISEPLETLKKFHIIPYLNGYIARTGYTGEDGFEFIVPENTALSIWNKLIEQKVQPIGLAARDTLRLEAGLNLYGSDMDEQNHPLEANLAWTLSWEPKERNFSGRSALEKIKETNAFKQQIGIILLEKGVLRAHQSIEIQGMQGEILSGTFSPSLQISIAFARLPHTNFTVINQEGTVDIRGKKLKIKVVPLPFIKNGKPTFNL